MSGYFHDVQSLGVVVAVCQGMQFFAGGGSVNPKEPRVVSDIKSLRRVNRPGSGRYERHIQIVIVWRRAAAIERDLGLPVGYNFNGRERCSRIRMEKVSHISILLH